MQRHTYSDIRAAITDFVAWLERYGETSFDHQSFFAGPRGGRSKALYYRKPWLGTIAVAPMIIGEAFLPGTRRLFWHRQRFPIADAHYAMAFAALARFTGEAAHYDRAVRFLNVLIGTRCPGYSRYCWGYPFDWVTRTGVIRAGTPLITTTPYVYEAFACVHQIDARPRWREIMQSIAEHAVRDIPERAVAPDATAAGYTPHDAAAGVINASAYRALLLLAAAAHFSCSEYASIGKGNLQFVLQAQQPDGSWFYAADGVRTFVDHFHTCFVLKALAKIAALGGCQEGCNSAIRSGVAYYVNQLFDERGLPKPFSKAPRLTVYRRELYDYAECINLGTLLRGRFPLLDQRMQAALRDLLAHWRKRDGSFRSRKLLIGWDNVPMHRWAQAQLFRSLCLLLCSEVDDGAASARGPAGESRGQQSTAARGRPHGADTTVQL
jgi:hypothetical protein